MGVTWSTSDADRRSRAARSASRPVGHRAATSQHGRLLRLRAALHRGRARLAHRPAPVELSPLAHALDVLAHR